MPPNPVQITCHKPTRIITKSEEGIWFSPHLKYNDNCKYDPTIHYDHQCGTPIYSKLTDFSLHSILQTNYNYILYNLNNKLTLSHRDIEKNTCFLSNRLSGDLIHVSNNIFYKALGDVVAIVKCKPETVILSKNETQCFTDIALTNDLFLDSTNHLIKNVSSQRPCSSSFPKNVVKSSSFKYYFQEPTLTEISIKKMSLFSNFSYDFNQTLDLLTEDEGLLSSSEWIDFDSEINYGHLRDTLTDNFAHSLCMNSNECANSANYINQAQPAYYNIDNLKFPDVVSSPMYEKIKLGIIEYAVEICLITLSFHVFLFLYQILDFICMKNDQNSIRLFIKNIMLCFRIIIKCFVKQPFHTTTPNQFEMSSLDPNISHEIIRQDLLSQ